MFGRPSYVRYALFVALCLPITGCATTPSPQTSIARPSVGTIPLYQSDGRVLVMMRIGGGELLPMIFDTGSDGNSIDRRIAKRFRLKRIGETIEVDGTTGTRRSLPNLRIDDVALGGLKVGALEAVALDYDPDDAMGIVSSEIFTAGLVRVELARNRVRLLPKSAATLPPGPATPYFEDIATIRIELPGGTTLPAHFDTGYNDTLSLPVAMMDKVPLMAPAKVVGRFKSIDTEGVVFGGQVRGSIKIGPVTLDNPQAAFLGDLANIGLPVIRRITLVLDPAEKRGWVVAPAVAD